MHWEDPEGSGGGGGGKGYRMGNTCKSVADSFQCMTKPTTIKNNNNKSYYLIFLTGTLGVGPNM